MAWGGERGVVVVDMSVRGTVCVLSAAALYHADRAAQRHSDRQRSPSLDQVNMRIILITVLPAYTVLDLSTSKP